MRPRRGGVRRAWNALGRDPRTRRLVQLAAACGVAVFSAAGNDEAAELRWLLDACLNVEAGFAPGRAEAGEANGEVAI